MREICKERFDSLVRCHSEFRRLFEGIEGGNGFDQASDSERVVDATGFTDNVQDSILAGQGNRGAHQDRDAGTVDLRHAIEVDNDLAGAFFERRSQSRAELVAGFADGQPAVNLKNGDARFFACVDFNGSVLGHGAIGLNKVLDKA